MTERETLCQNSVDEDIRACALERRAALRLANRFCELPGEVELHGIVEDPYLHVPDEDRIVAQELLADLARERQEISLALPRIDNLLPSESPATISERFASFIEYPTIFTLDLARTTDHQYNDWAAADRVKTDLISFSQEIDEGPYHLRVPTIREGHDNKEGIHAEVFNEEMINLGLVYLWDNQMLAEIVDGAGEKVATLGSREEFSLLIRHCDPELQALIEGSIKQYQGRLVGDALREVRMLVAFQDEAVRHKHTAVYCYRARAK
jgi:hypothetical protein